MRTDLILENPPAITVGDVAPSSSGLGPGISPGHPRSTAAGGFTLSATHQANPLQSLNALASAAAFRPLVQTPTRSALGVLLGFRARTITRIETIRPSSLCDRLCEDRRGHIRSPLNVCPSLTILRPLALCL